MGAKAIWREDLITSLLAVLLVIGFRMVDFLTFAGSIRRRDMHRNRRPPD